jgi:hypothetical protein
MSGNSRPDSTPRRLVLVVGPYRSGTSLFTGILGQLGFRVPQPEVKADDTNPRGFSEPRWVVDFHTRLMKARRVTVLDARPAAWEITADAAQDDAAFADLRSWVAVQFVGADSVVVKDPRIGWFLPLWLRCAEDLGVEASFVTMLRQPPQVLSSARQWYGTWQTDASRAAAWVNVTLHTELATRAARRAFVRYDALLENWSKEISRVAALLDLPWLADVERTGNAAVEGFVEPALHRETVGWDEVSVPVALRTQADHVWDLVTTFAQPGNGDREEVRAFLDEARAAYVKLYEEAEAIAQSSVTAVKPKRGQGASGAARSAAAAGKNGHGPLTAVVPAHFRDRARAATKLNRLVVRAALLVPVRYREKLPVPVVRGGLRVVRSLRR